MGWQEDNVEVDLKEIDKKRVRSNLLPQGRVQRQTFMIPFNEPSISMKVREFIDRLRDVVFDSQ